MAEVTIDQLMQALPRFFVPEKAAGVERTVQFQLSGEKGGDWVADIRDQRLTVSQGTVPNADLTLKADAQDILDIFTGKLDPMRAYMSGKLKLQGSMVLAMKLSQYFDVDLDQLRSIGQ